MPYKTNHVANTILQRAFKEKRGDVSPMKLQKLVYFLHGWHLAVTDAPAITDPVEAWPYGPVIESLYRQFKPFGGDPITNYAGDYDPESGTYTAYVVSADNAEFQEIFDAVWDKYSKFSAVELSALTHQNGTPWSIARQGGKKIIENSDIKRYFREFSKKG